VVHGRRLLGWDAAEGRAEVSYRVHASDRPPKRLDVPQVTDDQLGATLLKGRGSFGVADQDPDLDPVVEEPGDEPAADASSGSGHEYGHDVDSFHETSVVRRATTSTLAV
jgi:hypothetical protein